jgi:hypothetical protein
MGTIDRKITRTSANANRFVQRGRLGSTLHPSPRHHVTTSPITTSPRATTPPQRYVTTRICHTKSREFIQPAFKFVVTTVSHMRIAGFCEGLGGAPWQAKPAHKFLPNCPSKSKAPSTPTREGKKCRGRERRRRTAEEKNTAGGRRGRKSDNASTAYRLPSCLYPLRYTCTTPHTSFMYR